MTITILSIRTYQMLIRPKKIPPKMSLVVKSTIASKSKVNQNKIRIKSDHHLGKEKLYFETVNSDSLLNGTPLQSIPIQEIGTREFA
jgi:hypothetical protein